MDIPQIDEQALMASIDETMAKAFDAAEKEDDDAREVQGQEGQEEPGAVTAEAEGDDEGEAGEPEITATAEGEPEAPKEPEKPAEPDPRFKALDELIAPRREAWAMHGLNETQAINQLLTISDYADRDPAGFISWFAQQRGIDLKAFAQPPAGNADDDTDPTLAPVLAEVRELKTRLTQKEQESELQSQAQIAAQIESFRAAKAEDGKPKHPHFETVRADMAALIAQGRASSMEDAYNRAVWAHPETRAQLLAEQEKAKEAERVAKAKAAAAKAAKATAGSPASQGVNVAPASKSIDDTMAEAYDRAMSA